MRRGKNKVINLCGIPYKLTYFAGPRDNVRDDDESFIGEIDNDKREIRIEKGRSDTEYIIFHELVHGALEAQKGSPNSKVFEKYYGEGFVRPFARMLWGMIQEAGIVKVKKI